MKSLSSEIVINASMEKVWSILTDFQSYPDWNPFVIKISGELEEGASLDVSLKIEGRKETNFKPRVVSVIPGEKFCWRGVLFVKGIFDATLEGFKLMNQALKEKAEM